MDGGEQQSPRRFVVGFAVTTLIGLAAMAGLNAAVDPFGAFGVALIPADSRSGDTRTARAELLRRFTGETVLIGTSRTRVGYDGSHPAVPGGPALNVGLDGTHLTELALVVEHALANPHVRRIVLSLDWHLCAADWRPNADFECSRFNPQRSGFEQRCDLLWNGRTLEASLRAIRRAARAEPRQHDPLGFAAHAELRFERATQAVRTRAALEQFSRPANAAGTRLPRATTRTQLLQLLQACRTQDVDVTIVIDPVHSLWLEGLRRHGGWEAYCDWKHDVVTVAEAAGVPVWDFTACGRYTTEPLLSDDADESQWFWEPSHMRSALGNRVLERLFGAADADPGFGVRLTRQSLAEESDRAESAAAAWRASRPGELAQLARMLGDQDSSANRSSTRTAEAAPAGRQR